MNIGQYLLRNWSTYENKSPRDGIMLDPEEVDEIKNDARDDAGGQQLSEPQDMERQGRIWRRDFGDSNFRHLADGGCSCCI